MTSQLRFLIHVYTHLWLERCSMDGHLQPDQFHDGSYLHVTPPTQEPAASRRSLLSRPSVVLFFRSAGFPTTSSCFMSRVHICFQLSVTHTRFSDSDITAGVSEEWPDLSVGSCYSCRLVCGCCRFVTWCLFRFWFWFWWSSDSCCSAPLSSLIFCQSTSHFTTLFFCGINKMLTDV